MSRIHAPGLSPEMLARIAASPMFASCELNLHPSTTDEAFLRVVGVFLGLATDARDEHRYRQQIERDRAYFLALGDDGDGSDELDAHTEDLIGRAAAKRRRPSR